LSSLAIDVAFFGHAFFLCLGLENPAIGEEVIFKANSGEVASALRTSSHRADAQQHP
jgi:hypothetical protein